VDTQHGPMGYEKLSAMLSAIASGGVKSMVRVGGYDDRPGIQQALDLGSDGVLIPYINTADEARQAVSCAKYPTIGTRSVYFRHRPGRRISGKGIHLHQHRERPAPRADSSGLLCERHGENLARARQVLEAPGDGVVLAGVPYLQDLCGAGTPARRFKR